MGPSGRRRGFLLGPLPAPRRGRAALGTPPLSCSPPLRAALCLGRIAGLGRRSQRVARAERLGREPHAVAEIVFASSPMPTAAARPAIRRAAPRAIRFAFIGSPT